MDSWITWNLTGGVDGGLHVTDVTNASRTMLMNLETLDWDPVLLAALRIPRTMLREIRPTIGVFGDTVAPVAGIPIGAVIGDQQASLFGQTAFDAGEAKCTFGTGSFLLLNTGTEIVRSDHGSDRHGRPQDRSMSRPSTRSKVGRRRRRAGAVVPGQPRTDPDAGRDRDPGRNVSGQRGLLRRTRFLRIVRAGWNPSAQGLMVGLTAFVTKAHIARAVLEATAWQTRDVMDAMNGDAGLAALNLAVDGGMTSDNLLMQMIADILDIPVVRPMMAETVALGAAYAAGLAVGFWPDREVLRRNWQRAAEWRPKIDPARREAELRRWQHAVALADRWGELTTTALSTEHPI